jgi:hypothetical protein
MEENYNNFLEKKKRAEIWKKALLKFQIKGEIVFEEKCR